MTCNLLEMVLDDKTAAADETQAVFQSDNMKQKVKRCPFAQSHSILFISEIIRYKKTSVVNSESSFANIFYPNDEIVVINFKGKIPIFPLLQDSGLLTCPRYITLFSCSSM